MKKLVIFLISFVMGLLTITSCNSSESGPDLRDPFLGSYSYTMAGSYTMLFAGKNIDVPFAQGGTFRAYKDGSGNRVKIKGKDVSLKGTIEGDVIQLDPEYETDSKDGLYLVMTIEYTPAQLINNKLSIDGTIKGTISGGGQAGTLTGSLNINATKQ